MINIKPKITGYLQSHVLGIFFFVKYTTSLYDGWKNLLSCNLFRKQKRGLSERARKKYSPCSDRTYTFGYPEKTFHSSGTLSRILLFQSYPKASLSNIFCHNPYKRLSSIIIDNGTKRLTFKIEWYYISFFRTFSFFPSIPFISVFWGETLMIFAVNCANSHLYA